MKKPNLKIKPETLMSAGLVLLGVAQMVLTGHKDKSDRANMKAEIIEELSKDLTTGKS